MLKTGDKIKDFEIKDSSGQLVNISAFSWKYLVIFFYPKNNTIGCTKEVSSFNDLIEEFNKYKTSVVGISTDGSKSHASFIESYSFNVELLSDKSRDVSEYFGVLNKGSTSKKPKRAKRITFILNEAMEVIHIFDKVKPGSHGQEVLQFIKVRS